MLRFRLPSEVSLCPLRLSFQRNNPDNKGPGLGKLAAFLRPKEQVGKRSLQQKPD